MPELIQRAYRIWILCCAVAAVASLPGCGASNEGGEGEGEGPGRRYQALALSADQEVKLGDEAFQEVLQHEHPVDGAARSRCERSARRSSTRRSTTSRCAAKSTSATWTPTAGPWDFNDRKYAVLDEKEVNAFCLPGGKVAVFTGLLKMTEGHDDWLATVMGHEIAHALAHHASERIARQHMDGQALDVSSRGFGAVDNDDRLKLIDLLGVGLHAAEYDQHRASRMRPRRAAASSSSSANSPSTASRSRRPTTSASS